MRKIGLALVVMILGTAVAGHAQACIQTTLNNYLGSGFQCTVNDQTYTDWGYDSVSNPPGFSIPAGSVSVTPITTPGDPGFRFTAGWMVGGSTGIQSIDSSFFFNVTSTAPMTDLSLSIGGVGFTGTGSITLSETYCLGGVLPSCAGGTPGTISVFDSAAGQQLYNQVDFTGVNEISVEKDLLVVAGTNGSAEVSIITDQFSEGQQSVPEPSTLTMFGAGILAVAGLARRKLNL